MARRLDIQAIEKALDLLMEAELKVKRGRDPRLALEKLVVELTQVFGPR